MAETPLHGGIPSRPIAFSNGQPLPADLTASPFESQNLWWTIMRNQTWVGRQVLGMTTSTPYKESHRDNLQEDIAHADNTRGNPTRYADDRSIESFGILFGGVSSKMVQDEFNGSLVLDVGSGRGVFSEGLRAGGARTVELDFSYLALQGLPDVPAEQGTRILANGLQIPSSDRTYDRTVSMFSTSLHTDTIATRMQSLTEVLRVTKEGGRAFVTPLFHGVGTRQRQWHNLQSHWSTFTSKIGEENTLEIERILQVKASLDFTLTSLVHWLILHDKADVTPILTIEAGPRQKTDCIAGIFDVKQTLTQEEVSRAIDDATALFSD